MLPLLDFHELGAQHAHTGLLVLELIALGLAGDHNARGLVDEAHGRGGLVDMLATGTGGAIDLHFNILRADLHFYIIGDLGITSTAEKEVWRRPAASKGEMRTRRWTPDSLLRKP